MDTNTNTRGVIETRSSTLFGRQRKNSNDYDTDADKEYYNRKKEKLNAINEEIERRKSTYENI